jgi:multiple sugar transport system substrate-binding protein
MRTTKRRRFIGAGLAIAAGAGAGMGTTVSGSGSQTISVMIASSGPAETAAVEGAIAAWEEESGNTVELVSADDMNLQLGQALAGGDPPDVFYVNLDKFQEYASGGSLAPIGDQITDPDDFYPALTSAFTYEDELYCPPKDFSTLGLVINTDMWTEAGLTEADYPTTWEQLAEVAATLTTDDHVGLASGATRDRVGAFLVAAGGYFVSEDQSEVTADSPENLAALEYVKGLLDSDSYEFTENMDVGWGGEALGTGVAAMTIEGNWIRGAMTNDYPDINYTVLELPEGPAGRGSMAFTQCWGVAAASDQQEAGVDFVNFMTATDQQVALSNAFGVMPSRASAADTFLADNPDFAPFIAAAEYARAQVSLPAFVSVLTEFDAQLLAMSTGDAEPAEILADLQANGEDALEG